MPVRRSSVALTILVVLGLLTFLTLVHAHFSDEHAQSALVMQRSLVSSLGLTDLCLFTEARYTRHPSQADLHSPFQDHPLALEHFPSGSLLSPPEILTHRHGRLDP